MREVYIMSGIRIVHVYRWSEGVPEVKTLSFAIGQAFIDVIIVSNPSVLVRLINFKIVCCAIL